MNMADDRYLIPNAFVLIEEEEMADLNNKRTSKLQYQEIKFKQILNISSRTFSSFKQSNCRHTAGYIICM